MCIRDRRTASITGAFVALVLALDRMRQTDVLKKMPISDYVAATSVGIVGGMPLLDLAYEEDSKADVDMNIVKTGDGRFIEVQGTAESEPFDRHALTGLLELADVHYVGAGVLGSALCMDQAMATLVTAAAGLPPGRYLSARASAVTAAAPTAGRSSSTEPVPMSRSTSRMRMPMQKWCRKAHSRPIRSSFTRG